MTVKKQSRQRRALERFVIDPQRAKSDSGYAARKQQELEALRQAVK